MANSESISLNARYQGAWAEVQMRVNARDQMLGRYLVASSTILGVALANPQLLPLALVIPFLSFFVALTLAHHDFVTNALNLHIRQMVVDAGLGHKDWFTSPKGLGTALWVGAAFHTTSALSAIGVIGVWALLLVAPTVGEGKASEAIWFSAAGLEAIAILILVASRIYRIRTEKPASHPTIIVPS
jgi:hypothetical protein